MSGQKRTLYSYFSPRPSKRVARRGDVPGSSQSSPQQNAANSQSVNPELLTAATTGEDHDHHASFENRESSSFMDSTGQTGIPREGDTAHSPTARTGTGSAVNETDLSPLPESDGAGQSDAHTRDQHKALPEASHGKVGWSLLKKVLSAAKDAADPLPPLKAALVSIVEIMNTVDVRIPLLYSY